MHYYSRYWQVSFTKRIAKVNLTSNSDTANFVKKTDFDKKLKTVTSNKNKKTNYQKKLKQCQQWFVKDLINKFSILERGKHFSSRVFQNYLVLMPSKKCIKYFSGTTRIDPWKSNGMSKILKILLNQTVTLNQLLLIIKYYQT